MESEKIDKEQIPFIRELCKHKTEEEIREAEENFRAYLLLVKRICKRLEQEETEALQVDEVKTHELH